MQNDYWLKLILHIVFPVSRYLGGFLILAVKLEIID